MGPQAGDVVLPSIRTAQVGVGDHNGVRPRPLVSAGPNRFQLCAFLDAIGQGDAEAQIRAYADRATLQLIDPDHPPRSRKLLAGKAEITAWIRDMCSQQMTHRVVDIVNGGAVVAFGDEMCDRNGTQMASTTTATINHGLIVRSRVVLVWDGWD